MTTDDEFYSEKLSAQAETSLKSSIDGIKIHLIINAFYITFLSSYLIAAIVIEGLIFEDFLTDIFFLIILLSPIFSVISNLMINRKMTFSVLVFMAFVIHVVFSFYFYDYFNLDRSDGDYYYPELAFMQLLSLSIMLSFVGLDWLMIFRNQETIEFFKLNNRLHSKNLYIFVGLLMVFSVFFVPYWLATYQK